MRAYSYFSAAIVVAACLGGCQGRESEAPPPVSSGGHEQVLADGERVAAAPVRVLVIVDGFREVHRQYYLDTVIPKVRAGFERLPGADASKIQIRRALLPSRFPDKTESRLGLTYDGNARAACYFTNRTDVLSDIYRQKADGDSTFAPNRYVVILAGTGDGACAMNDVMFIRENVGSDVVAHEMGHSLAGLLDEYSDSGAPGVCIRWRNCSTDREKTPWTKGNGIDAFTGCHGYKTGIYRPAEVCRMSDPRDEFCPVCRGLVTEALETGIQTVNVPKDGGCAFPAGAVTKSWPLALSAKDGIDVIATVGEGNQIRVLDVVESDASALRPQVVTGDMFFVAYEGNKVVGVAPISTEANGSLLSSRSYAIDDGGRDIRVPDTRALVRLTLLGVRREDILSRNLAFALRRIPGAQQAFRVDADTVARLAEKAAEPRVDINTQLGLFVQ